MSVGGLTETVDVVANSVMIDTTTTATDTNMSQDLLFSMPISHDNPAVNILDYMPGVNDGSAFGGASDGANSLMLDGVDTRDPEGGTAWTFYNYNIIDEVQVGGLGQTAEYGGFTGAVINTITKSGGNRFSSLSEYRYSNNNGFFSSNNTNSDLGRPEPDALHDRPGPEHEGLHGAARRADQEGQDLLLRQHPALPRSSSTFRRSRTEIEPALQPQVHVPADGERQHHRVAAVRPVQPDRPDRLDPRLRGQQPRPDDRPGLARDHLQRQYRKVFNASTFLEAKFMGWWGYYDLNPVSQAPTHYDRPDPGQPSYSGGAGYTEQFDRTRNQVNVSLSKYAQFAGTHNFKFGVEIERSSIRDRFNYSGSLGVMYYDY